MQAAIENPNDFSRELHRQFRHVPNQGQERLFHAFGRLVYTGKERCALIIKGYAGTGKTSCTAAMVRTLKKLGIATVMLAPTGRAAKVLSNYSGLHAYTIHRQIYQRRTTKQGGVYFTLRQNKLKNAVFFVDEASMIGTDTQGMPGQAGLLDDLMHYIFSSEGCKLVLIGDEAQLPPIGSEHSPALQAHYLGSQYQLHIAACALTEVMRQKRDSGILDNATSIRALITDGTKQLPRFTLNGYTDMQLVQGDIQPVVEHAMQQFGIDSFAIITRSNKRANEYNRQVRLRVLGHEEEINAGDRMMILRNNYFWLDEAAARTAGFIANGDVAEVMRVRNFEELGPFRFCRATIRLVDYEDVSPLDVCLLCNTIWEEGPNLPKEKNDQLYQLVKQQHAHLGDARAIKSAMQKDEYWNALHVKFAYAITCHKAQGGQWPCVLLDQGYVTDEMAGRELNRWYYTALTRAQQQVHLIGFDERMIENSN